MYWKNKEIKRKKLLGKKLGYNIYNIITNDIYIILYPLVSVRPCGRLKSTSFFFG